MDNKTTLVIPDSHVMPDEDLSRFHYLGQFIVDHQPDNIVQIGDFMTLDAFSAWDMNKRANMEGRRYQAEMEAARNALELIFSPLRKLQKSQRKHKKKVYKPNIQWLEGNHEDREKRYLETKPELIGTIDYKSEIGLNNYNLSVIPYKSYVEVEGVMFTHIPFAGNSAAPIGGKYVLHRAVDLHNSSVVFGHTHRYGTLNNTRHGHKELNQAMMVGCYIDVIPEYAQGGLMDWWSGLVLMKHIPDSRNFDVETFSMKTLVDRYG